MKTYIIFLLQIFIFLYSSKSYSSDKCQLIASDVNVLEQIIIDKVTSQTPDSFNAEIISSNDSKIPEGNICVKSYSVDKKSLSFKALVSVESKNFMYFGKYNYQLLLPVLNKSLEKNEIIKESDLMMLEYNAKEIGPNIITDKNKLIGKAIRNKNRSGVPIFDKDLINPIIITKNSQINVIFEKKLLKIKLVGIALDNGSMGEIIRIKNSRSNNIFSATVIGDNLAEVKVSNY